MGFLIIGGMVAALAVGIWVGIGAPGVPGRQDRVVGSGRAQRLKKQHIDLLKTRW